MPSRLLGEYSACNEKDDDRPFRFRSFYGITIVQTYIYFKRSVKDSVFLKCLVSRYLYIPRLVSLRVHDRCFSYGKAIPLQAAIGYQLEGWVTNMAHRVLDTLHFALVIHAIYYYAVTNFMNPRALAKPTWCVSPTCLFHLTAQ